MASHNHHAESGSRPRPAKPLGKSARNRIHSITGDQVQRLLLKLDVISSRLPFLSSLPMQELTSSRDCMPGEVAAGSDGGKVAKGNSGMGRHVLQESSVLGHLRRIGAFDNIDDDEVSFQQQKQQIAIEFGAGTGRLSERLQRCTKQGMRHILIDRQEFTPNQCRDGAMRNRAADTCNGESSVERITGDIADFRFGEYCFSQVDGDNGNGPKSTICNCFCMSKHLCGPACDLAIAALGGDDVPSHSRPPFAFATCCHYLCNWESFSGKDYWLRLGLTEDDFEVAVAASQWYSIKGGRKNNQVVTEGARNEQAREELSQNDLISVIDNTGQVLKNLDEDALRPSMPSKDFEQLFAREEKARLGGIVKRLLDLSRVARLQEMGYKAELVLYTTRSIENRLLVGRL